MKTFNILAVIFLLFQMQTYGQNGSYATYGEPFEKATHIAQYEEVLNTINIKDTIATQFSGTIAEVCQAKGCWMKVNLDQGEQVFVKFKDYGFFVPTNVANSKVVLNGIAFSEKVSIEEQKHYAEDSGKSKEEISKIKAPKRTLRFEASGVLIVK
nr:DUF4920 domain-containing protein [uncultured Allomuricauda sp.]